ncbi:ribonuclease HII [Candidatus Woesearchaeota archaeon]|nr:MAG: ribonuclease HII [Candidatus Woesearchaeota archaeon]
MRLIAGIEEAGRGPIIGPMVMCGILIVEGDELRFKALKVKDSKLLTPNQREKLYKEILKIAKKHEIEIITPSQIDAALKSDSLNLNKLEAITSANIINKLKPDKVILDCPSNNVKMYVDFVNIHLKNPNIDLLAEHKADVNHPVVAAASIIAKVVRDRKIEQLKKKIGQDFGSGYTSDPVTRSFLEKNWEKYPDIFRKTWITYKKIKKAKHQRKLEGY